MNKWYAMLPACLLWTALAAPGFAGAADPQVRVYLDGKPIQFEVQPILENGTTLVQFRPIFENIGLTIGWDEATRTVTGTKDDLSVKLVIDDTEAYINDRLNELELAPRLVGDNTFVPLRFVSEASGKEVTWDGNSKSVHIISPANSTGPGNSGGTPGGGSSGDRTKPGSDTDATKPEKGDYTYPNGDRYTGQMVNGYPEGRGKLYNLGGKLLFDGMMTNGLPGDGRIKSYYENGQLEFDGNLKNGVRTGSGKQYSTTGSLLFDGTFSVGEREKGTLYYDNGDKYIGPFDNDKPSGAGKLVYKNGDVYEGDFFDGRREGKGTYKTTKGEKLVGDFKNNMMNGVISHYDIKGVLLSVSEFSNDVLIRKVDMGNKSSTLPNTNSWAQPNRVKLENDRHQKLLDTIRENYNQNKKQLDDQIAQIRKDNPGTYTSQAEYNKAQKQAETKQTDISNRLNSLAGDNSKATEAAKAELNKQLTNVQTLITQIHTKGAAQQRIEALRDQLDFLRENYNNELKRANDQHLEIIKELK
ncbi:stalk domain-containing protein [Paenibacillus elgii]